MIAIMMLVYTGVAVLLFKFKLLKPRPFPIAGVVLGGILIIGAVVAAWKQGAPISSRVVTVQPVVQLVPYVKGQVIKIHAKANRPMRKGDLLLEINPDPYQFTVNQSQAQLDTARQGVTEARAGVEAARAAVSKSKAGVDQAAAGVGQSKAAVANARAAIEKAKASVANAQAALLRAAAADELAKTEEQIALDLRKADAGAISVLRVAQATQKRKEAAAALTQADAGVGEAQAAEKQAEAGLRQAQADEVQAEAGLVAAKALVQQSEAGERQSAAAADVAESKVPAAQAQLADARFNLDQCRLLAPADGYVVNWMIQEGQMIAATSAMAAGTFICTSETIVVASFPQNQLANVQPGDDVEVILDPYPGRLFKAKVDYIIPASGEGQFDPSKTIPEASTIGSQGLLAVRISFTDGPPPGLGLGVGGVVAIYTDAVKPVHVVSKVVLRMKKWMLYVVPS